MPNDWYEFVEYASLVSLYTGSFESTVENHLNSIKELKTLDEYKTFILSRVDERLTNDYFDITLLGSEGLAVSGRGNNAWNAYVAALNILDASLVVAALCEAVRVWDIEAVENVF